MELDVTQYSGFGNIHNLDFFVGDNGTKISQNTNYHWEKVLMNTNYTCFCLMFCGRWTWIKDIKSLNNTEDKNLSYFEENR